MLSVRSGCCETGSHLFLGCVFSRQVWLALLGPLQLLPLMPVGDDGLGEWWIQQRGRIDQASKPLFDSLLLLIAWTV